MKYDIRATQNDAVYSATLVVWEIMEGRVVFGEYGKRGNFRHDDFLHGISDRKLQQLEPPSCENDNLKEIMRRGLSFDHSLRPNALEAYSFLTRTYTLINECLQAQLRDPSTWGLLEDGIESRNRRNKA
ncbi:unnamed protein product, partial [Mesorhabditis belari]|uniref:Uncharacterized protein n=1 Tax=Mesorhabditis belari TaxID=2138241 RepID=A0AAF3JCD7_9BILA